MSATTSGIAPTLSTEPPSLPTTFRNPVVRGVAPDPSVCRVGNDFFMATSTFDFWPGIPIRHSTDLVNWTVIGHAVTRPEQFRPGGAPGLFTLFAPTLRYHDGTFFLTSTNAAPQDPELGRAGGNVGNFIVHTQDPAGEWSDAAWVDRLAFDPSLTFADDTCYFLRRTFNIANGVKGLGPVVQAEIDPFTGELAAELVPITEGQVGFCSNDIEGSHLYKIGDTYYLFSAEGGTEKGHMQTCARSSSPWGPFESAPNNPVLTHRHLVLHPIQRTGHAELIEAPDGSWWAMFLATREDRIQGAQILGRESFLAPVEWRDGWPVIGNDGVVDLEMPAPQLPSLAGSVPTPPPSPWLNGWSTRQAPLRGLTIGTDDGSVELPVTTDTLDDDGQVGAAFLRQLEHRASFHATVGTPTPGVVAGITAYTGPQNHFDLYVSVGTDRPRVTLRRCAADLVTEQHVSLPDDGEVTLTVDCDGENYSFAAQTAAGVVPVGSGSARLLDTDFAPGFGSVRFGVYACGPADGMTVRFSDAGGDNVG